MIWDTLIKFFEHYLGRRVCELGRRRLRWSYLVIGHLLQVQVCAVDQTHACVSVICASERAPVAGFGDEAVVFLSTALNKSTKHTSAQT